MKLDEQEVFQELCAFAELMFFAPLMFLGLMISYLAVSCVSTGVALGVLWVLYLFS